MRFEQNLNSFMTLHERKYGTAQQRRPTFCLCVYHMVQTIKNTRGWNQVPAALAKRPIFASRPPLGLVCEKEEPGRQIRRAKSP
jgi:hypothetical protein